MQAATGMECKPCIIAFCRARRAPREMCALLTKTIDDLLGQRLGPANRRVDAEMCLLIGRALREIQMLERRAICGERPPSVLRDPGDRFLDRDIEPNGHAIGVDD